jgi:hypothetical protein
VLDQKMKGKMMATNKIIKMKLENLSFYEDHALSALGRMEQQGIFPYGSKICI